MACEDGERQRGRYEHAHMLAAKLDGELTGMWRSRTTWSTLFPAWIADGSLLGGESQQTWELSRYLHLASTSRRNMAAGKTRLCGEIHEIGARSIPHAIMKTS